MLKKCKKEKASFCKKIVIILFNNNTTTTIRIEAIKNIYCPHHHFMKYEVWKQSHNEFYTTKGAYFYKFFFFLHDTDSFFWNKDKFQASEKYSVPSTQTPNLFTYLKKIKMSIKKRLVLSNVFLVVVRLCER